ncbi:MAG: ABC transporter ATP-binding protein [Planctomycetota bacterium]
MTDLPSDPVPDRREARFPWRTWSRLARPEAGTLLLGLLLVGIGSTSTLVFPAAIGLLVDGAGERSAATRGAAALLRPLVRSEDGGVSLERLGTLLVALFALSSASLALRYLLLSNAGERIVLRLRRDAFDAVVRQEPAWLDRNPTGELTSRLTADCTKVQGVLTDGLVGGVRSLFVSAAGIALLLAQSPGLTGVMLAGLPPVCALAMVVGLRLGKLSKKVQDAVARTSDVAEQHIGRLVTVRLFGADARASRVYAASADEVARAAFRRNRWGAGLTGGAMFGVYVAMGAVIWFGARWMESGALTPGDLVAFAMLSAFVVGALTELVGLFTEVSSARGATARLEELLSREPELPASGSVRIDDWRGDFRLVGARFAYPTRPDVPVLQGFDLEVGPGSMVALVGPSGGGKSTVVSLVTRLYELDAGELSFGGVPAHDVDVDWLRSRVAVVPQDPALLSGTLRENLLLAKEDATEAEIARACRSARVDAFATEWPDGLGTRVGEGGRQLSGGQRQRVALARALLRDPALLILDEATSHLDAESERLVQEALLEVEAGRTVLVVAHRLATVLRADRVLVVVEGRVVESGEPSQLRAAGGIFARWLEWQSTDPISTSDGTERSSMDAP